MPPINEESRRRETFDPGRSSPVDFGGSPWHLPRPSWWVCPKFSGGKVTHTVHVMKYGRELSWVDDLVAELADCETPEALITGAATIAGALLAQNYILDPDELDSLLCFSGVAGSTDWVKQVMSVVTNKGGEA